MVTVAVLRTVRQGRKLATPELIRNRITAATAEEALRRVTREQSIHPSDVLITREVPCREPRRS